MLKKHQIHQLCEVPSLIYCLFVLVPVFGLGKPNRVERSASELSNPLEVSLDLCTLPCAGMEEAATLKFTQSSAQLRPSTLPTLHARQNHRCADKR